jgi:alkyldihydroxyacetonephosphate synthase
MGDGRIEALFAGGHLETPVGPLDLPPFPASAAGPDLRQVVLGSEGRLGILTEVIVRTAPQPVRDVVRAYALPDWERALELARTLADARLPLSMVRVSTPIETATMIALIPSDRSRRLLRRYLGWRGQGGAESCLILVGMAGSDKVVRAVEGEVGRLIRDRRGIGVPTLGPAWARERYRAPYLRDALWAAGYAVDTVETAVDWSRLPALAAALGPALRHGLEADGERVHAYSHLSHLYPSGSSLYVTFAFRLAPDPDQTLDRWRRLKTLASQTIVAHGGTISHQHGVGRVHAPYLAAEKGTLGMAALDGLIERFDPRGVLARGVLVEGGGS